MFHFLIPSIYTSLPTASFFCLYLARFASSLTYSTYLYSYQFHNGLRKCLIISGSFIVIRVFRDLHCYCQDIMKPLVEMCVLFLCDFIPEDKSVLVT